MPRLTYLYWGIWRYFSNASCQAASDSGGTAPMIGCHSVMERPEPVSRVAPPRLTIRKTSAATANSHTRTGSSAACGQAQGGDNARCCAMRASLAHLRRAFACGAWSPATTGAGCEREGGARSGQARCVCA